MVFFTRGVDLLVQVFLLPRGLRTLWVLAFLLYLYAGGTGFFCVPAHRCLGVCLGLRPLLGSEGVAMAMPPRCCSFFFLRLSGYEKSNGARWWLSRKLYRRLQGALNFNEHRQWSRRPQPKGRGGDATPRKDTRWEHWRCSAKAILVVGFPLKWSWVRMDAPESVWSCAGGTPHLSQECESLEWIRSCDPQLSR